MHVLAGSMHPNDALSLCIASRVTMLQMLPIMQDLFEVHIVRCPTLHDMLQKCNVTMRDIMAHSNLRPRALMLLIDALPELYGRAKGTRFRARAKQAFSCLVRKDFTEERSPKTQPLTLRALLGIALAMKHMDTAHTCLRPWAVHAFMTYSSAVIPQLMDEELVTDQFHAGITNMCFNVECHWQDYSRWLDRPQRDELLAATEVIRAALKTPVVGEKIV